MSAYPEIRLLVGAEWRARSGALIINPADGTCLGTVPTATLNDLADAVAAAVAGLAAWRVRAPAERSRIIVKAASLMRERIEEFSLAMTLDQGKPLQQSRLEVVRGCEMLEWDAAEGQRLYGRIIPSVQGMRYSVQRQPIGVVAAFSPWNFPMSSPARKMGGALASGCSLILKPSEETPAAAMLMARAFLDAGLPAGVLNLVYGEPAVISEYLIAQPAVRAIAFTGSLRVGKQLAALAAEHMKPALMELGGHAPVIVCEDADVARAAELSVLGKLRNSGQVCVAPTRFFVHRSVFDEFVASMAQKADSVRLGSGLDPSSDMGPLVNERRVLALRELVDDAVARGARVLCGGARRAGAGYYFPLTLLADVPGGARIMNEEPFGPVAILNRVESLDEAIAQANALPYGLAGYAFTGSAANVYRLSEELELGNLSINHFTASVAETPFGGVKGSGYGREGGSEGLESYTVVKTVSHQVVP